MSTFELRAYNPRTATAETLETLFVGRQALLDELLDDLRRQATSASRQHWLIYGPRGMGKTHLSGLVYHRVRQSPELAAAYFPIWLPELDAYTAYSAGKLLAQIAEQASCELSSRGEPEAAHRLRSELGALGGLGDDDEYFQGALGLLRDLARRRQRHLLILLENLDALLVALSRQQGGLEARRLRQALLENTELLFVSTTPTRYLSALHHPKQPLFGHFRERRLDGLTAENVTELLTRLAEMTGRPLPVDGRRSWLLHRLTGGNPRAIGMAFGALGGGTDLADVVADFERLLDLQTPYFEARLAHLAPRERAIVEALALARNTLTIQEIAQISRLPEKSLSTQVKRLQEEGHVQPALGEKGKGSLYELADGLLRLWFQYRRGRQELEPLIRFLALWYRPEDLEKRLFDLPLELDRSWLERDTAELVRVQIEAALRWALSEEGKKARSEVTSAVVIRLAGELAAAVQGQSGQDFSKQEQELNEYLEHEGASLSNRARFTACFVLFSSYSSRSLWEAALGALGKAPSADKATEVDMFILSLSSAASLAALGQFEKALASCDAGWAHRSQAPQRTLDMLLSLRIKLLIALERFGEVSGTFDQWRALNPPVDADFCEVHYFSGVAAFNNRRLEEARERSQIVLASCGQVTDRIQTPWFSNSLILALSLGSPLDEVERQWNCAKADSPLYQAPSRIDSLLEVLRAVGEPSGRGAPQRKRKALARVAPESRDTLAKLVDALLVLSKADESRPERETPRNKGDAGVAPTA
jgi:AAA+ ATPase superfamily predicted ATPase